jgi:hypothetical protein
MSDHPIINQLKQVHGYHDDASAHDVTRGEALKLSLRTPHERGIHMHSVDREIEKYPDASPTQQLQMHRFKAALKHADRKLRDAGR